MRPPDSLLLPIILPFLASLNAAACADSSAAPDAGRPDASARATVTGTLTLPGATTGKPFSVRILSTAGVPGTTPVGEASGLTAGGTTLSYFIADVPAGTYFVLAFVDVDSSGGQSSTPGDQVGWFGHTGDGNPPSSANAVVPPSGSARFDFSLVVR